MGATSYQLDVSPTSLFSSFVQGYDNLPITGTSQVVANIDVKHNAYYYRIRAVNPSGVSANSNSITVIAFPTPPIALEVINKTGNSFTANWQIVPTATEYRFDVSTDILFSSFISGYENLRVTGTSLNVTGLVLRAAYHYRVRAVNSSGTSDDSNIIVGANFDQNYVSVVNVKVAGKLSSADVESAAPDEKLITTEFIDGLGRSIQTIAIQNSPSRKDIVQPVAYDEFGRKTKNYLPYADVNTGWFKDNALMDPLTVETTDQGKYRSGKQYAFYQAGSNLASDNFPYAETIFESAPLNRVLKQGAPGAAWQPTQNPSDFNDHSIKKIYSVNANAEVYQFLYYPSTGLVSLALTNSGFYAAGQLFSNKTFDEQNNDVIEYVDKEGRVVCKKVKAGTTAYASTYYIYDDFGNLAVVLPPEGVNNLVSQY